MRVQQALISTKVHTIFVLNIILLLAASAYPVQLTSFTLSATNTIPFSIGKPCSTSGDSVMFFTYERTAGTLSRQSTCRPYLASPGLSAFATSVSFNPADGYLYMIRFTSSSGV